MAQERFLGILAIRFPENFLVLLRTLRIYIIIASLGYFLILGTFTENSCYDEVP